MSRHPQTMTVDDAERFYGGGYFEAAWQILDRADECGYDGDTVIRFTTDSQDRFDSESLWEMQRA